jgi:hypothetical protein
VCNISLSDNATGAPKLNPFFAPVPKCTLCTRAGTSFVSFPPSPQLLPSARAKRTDMSAPRTAIFAAGVSPSSASLSLILWMRLAPGESIPGRLLYAFYTLPSSSSHTSHSNKHFLPCFLHSTRSSICLPHSNIFHLKSVSNIGPSFTLTFGQSSTHSHSPSVNISVNNQSTRPHHGRTSSSSSSSSSSLHSTTSLGPNINQHH